MKTHSTSHDGVIEYQSKIGSISIKTSVFTAIKEYRQLSPNSPESGGMLFAEIEKGIVKITLATEPTSADRRTRFGFWPSLSAQQKIINAEFKQGLHFVGEWHTHPEPYPTPSGTDLRSMADCYKRSKHQLRGLVMIIVGQGTGEGATWVSIHNETGYTKMTPAPITGLSSQVIETDASEPHTS